MRRGGWRRKGCIKFHRDSHLSTQNSDASKAPESSAEQQRPSDHGLAYAHSEPKRGIIFSPFLIFLFVWCFVLLLSCIDLYLRIRGVGYRISSGDGLDRVAFWLAVATPLYGIPGVIWGPCVAKVFAILLLFLGGAWFLGVRILLAQL